MLAKRFFYVCAGLLCLALAYHLGARSATAQSGTLEGANIEAVFTAGGEITYYTAAIGRAFYWTANPGYVPRSVPDPIPGSSAVVATGANNYGFTALLLNGDMYTWDSAKGPVWIYRGNMVGLPTPATQETWGGPKARYR